MKMIKKIEIWGDQHHPKWLDFFRILLGIILIWKGIDFYLHMEAFNRLMRGAMLGTAISISLLAHLIILAHLIGGLAIAIGTHTRMFSLLNLPILIGAVFFVNTTSGIFRPYTEFWVSLSVLLGLICFMVEGNGIIAVDRQSTDRD